MEPRIIPRAEHPISRKDIDPDVLRVLYRLHHAGFQACLVGGAVRDLLRGAKPKDFDIATDATPSQVRGQFRNSRTVGKRFRIVHVFYGDKNVEVSTFRTAVAADGDGGGDGDDLYVEDDNTWGDTESDAFRRDFTVNALFYRINDFAVIDYVGGLEDLQAGVIRAIGEASVRMQEDPVRILRAIKFAARFGYRLDPATEAAMREHVGDLHKASRFRVTEEIFRILTQANRAQGLRMLESFGVLRTLYPHWVEAIGIDGFDQVVEFYDELEREAADGRHQPLEVVAAGLFLPFLDHVDPAADDFTVRAAALVGEIHGLGDAMELPRRLMTAVATLLRGQLHLLFFAHRPANVQRFVRRPEFDWVWRLHELAFGHIRRLHGLQEVWLTAREAVGTPIVGFVDTPDRRDVFSFRGATGGGRRGEDDPASIVGDEPQHRGGRRRRRRR